MNKQILELTEVQPTQTSGRKDIPDRGGTANTKPQGASKQGRDAKREP